MGVNLKSLARKSGKTRNVTSIIRSQRSNCNVVIYRWQNPDMTKLTGLDVSKNEGPEAARGNLEGRKPRVVIRNDVVRCNISKNKSSSSGSFSLTLKRGKQVINGVIQAKDINYLDVINPGDWIMIYIKKQGNTIDVNSTRVNSGLKLIGIVENVRYIEMDQPDKGSPRLEYVVTGKDFGKIFDMSIFFNPKINQASASSLLGADFITNSFKSLKGMSNAKLNDFTPDNVIKGLVDFYLGGNKADIVNKINATNQAWYIPNELAAQFKPDLRDRRGGVAFTDILSRRKIGLHKYSNNRFVEAKSLPGAALIKALPADGTVWGVLQFMQNAIVNEMFTELSDKGNGFLEPSLIMRQIPFSNPTNSETNPFKASEQVGKKKFDSISALPGNNTLFRDLPRHQIISSDIRQKNVGKSEHERINHVLIQPKIDDSEVENIAWEAIINTPSIQRYGLQTFQGQTSYVINSDMSLKKTCQFFTHLFVDWFLLGHLYFNGTIIIDGRDDHIELGNNLWITDVNQLYHIEGYNHSYENAPGGETRYDIELTVTRGQVLEGSNTKFIGPSRSPQEPTTISTSVLEGVR